MSTIQALLIRNDISFYYAVNKRSHYKNLCNLMKRITLLGSTPFAVILSLISLLLRNNLSTVLIANLVVSQFFIQALKRIVNRPRPYKTLEGAIAIKPPKCKYSLPSGHSSSAMSIALVLSCFFPLLTLLFVLVALLVGISRILLGCHYPSDVLVGVLISIIVFSVLKSFI